MHSNMCLEFDTKEEAIRFCSRQGECFAMEHLGGLAPILIVQNTVLLRRLSVVGKWGVLFFCIPGPRTCLVVLKCYKTSFLFVYLFTTSHHTLNHSSTAFNTSSL